jgi:hypothetical protein
MIISLGLINSEDAAKSIHTLLYISGAGPVILKMGNSLVIETEFS